MIGQEMTTQEMAGPELVTPDVWREAMPGVDFPRDAQGHFRLHLTRLIAHMIDNMPRALPAETLENLLAEYPFIHAYHHDLAGIPFDELLADVEADFGGHLPLRALQRDLALTENELWMLLAAGLVEEDIRFGALFAALQHPLPSRTPCLGVLSWLLAREGDGEVAGWTVAETLAGHGLLDIERGEERVRLEWTVRAPLPIWDALRGQRDARPIPALRRQHAVEARPLDTLILPADLTEQVVSLPLLVEEGNVGTLVVRGMTGSGRRTTLSAIARASGRDILLHEEEKFTEESRCLLGPLATLTGALPVLRLHANPGETVTLDRLPGYAGALGVIMGRSGGIDGSAMENALTLLLPPPDQSQRARFWQATGIPLSAPSAQVIAERFQLTGGRIHRIAALAQNQMRLENRDQVTPQEVQTAMRAVNRQALETLATPLTPVDGWSTLVVHPRIESELQVLSVRCEQREQLLAHVGVAFTRNLNRGVRALFSGPSGTGKTLAARALAGVLDMDLYRVDLASIVNKYIGETEKNLHRVFTYAEELDIILLLDEGDSLMTQRTDVRGSNDRYANLETNYLLQRLESYEGIILVTTNASQRIDQAFVRRLDVVVDFAAPEAEQRRQLWRLHLPVSHQVSDGFMTRVVQRCTLTGGQIRNAALHASLLALQDGEAVGDRHLHAALQREHRKASLPYPLASLSISKSGI